MIEFRNVQKIYQSKKSSSTSALQGINLKIGNAGMLFIVGKSGSGKSTFLNLLGGLDQPTSGEIFVHGKDICQFSKKQYDSYRNTYIGFIFQEFNVLEQYNVLENIELALKLQNQKSDSVKIQELLHQLGLNDLEKRNINELSGGQKQRVAIARALIKNPKVILADEPTGNLDRASSEQIFQILKEISKKQLVIVVSHDMESAHRYADRIVELEDGKVAFDSNPCSLTENENISFKKSKLPFSYAFKMAIANMKRKPLKFFMTILLTAISLVFMGFAVNCSLFDPTNLVINTMQKNHDYKYTVTYTLFSLGGGKSSSILEENHLAEIKKKTDSLLNPIYSLYHNGERLAFTFGESEEKPVLYFQNHPYSFEFVEIKDSRILGNLIGREPEQPNELVVHQYFADYAIKYGILTPDGTFYFPKDYQEFVNSKQEIQLGENRVIIVGIIDDDNSPFLSFQKTFSTDHKALSNYFQTSYVNPARFIYGKGFVDIAIVGNQKENLLKYMNLKNPNQQEFLAGNDGNLLTLTEEISAITQEGMQPFSNLPKNQVIVSLEALKIFDPGLESEFNLYLSTHKTQTYEELYPEFMKNYLQKNSQNLKLQLNIHYVSSAQASSTQSYPDLEIIGVSLDDKSYISNQYLEEYQPATKEIFSVQIYDDNISHLRKSLQQMVHPGSIMLGGHHYAYAINPLYSDISSIIGIYRWLTYLIAALSIVFILFSFLLFSHFIAVSISYCKKEIGILRALGASGKDIIKIFGYESIMVGFFSWLFSIIGWVATCKILNQSLYSSTYYIIEPIMMHPWVPVILFFYTITIALLITIASIQRITKIKPIDAILNK